MATRTEPIRLLLVRVVRGVGGLVVAPGGALSCLCGQCGLAGPLGDDELVEPAHLAFDRLESVLLELEGVGVETVAGPRDGRADVLEALLEPGAPALEDA